MKWISLTPWEDSDPEDEDMEEDAEPEPARLNYNDYIDTDPEDENFEDEESSSESSGGSSGYTVSEVSQVSVSSQEVSADEDESMSVSEDTPADPNQDQKGNNNEEVEGAAAPAKKAKVAPKKVASKVATNETAAKVAPKKVTSKVALIKVPAKVTPKNAAGGDAKLQSAIKMAMDESNPNQINLEVTPKDGYWLGGTFLFKVEFSEENPTEPPVVTCKRRVFHPQISLEGKVQLTGLVAPAAGPNAEVDAVKAKACLDAVGSRVCSLFDGPVDVKKPLNKEAAKLFKLSLEEFAAQVKYFIEQGS